MMHCSTLVSAVSLLLATPCAAQHWFDGVSLHYDVYGSFSGVADLDGDGDVELVSRGNNSWSVHTVSGAGDLSVATTIATASGIALAFNTPLIADFDGDGKTDIAWLEGNFVPTPAQYHVALHMGLGGLAFAPPLLRSILLPPRYGVIGDYDADGLQEIGVLSRSNDGTQARLGWYGIDAGAWSVAVISMNELGITSSIAALDFDADGRADLAAPVAGALRIFTYDSLSSLPAWTGTVSLPSGMSHSSLAVLGGDFDGDGDGDLVAYAGSTSSIQQPLLLLEQQAPSLLSIGTVKQIFKTLPMHPIGGDWDGDGDLDLAIDTLVYEHDAGNLAAEISTAPGTVSHVVAQAVGLADIDGDGYEDLLGQEWIRWGDGEFSAHPQGPLFDNLLYTYPSFTADADGDGDLDGLNVGFQHVSAGNAWQSTPLQLEPLASGASWRPRAAADFDGDGAVDVLAAKWVMSSPFGQPVPDAIYLLRGDGLGRWPVADAAPVFPYQDVPPGYETRQLVADAEADGDLDVLLRSGFAWNAGNGTFPVVDALSTNGVQDAADFDSDGDLDLVAWPAGAVNALQWLQQLVPQSYQVQSLPIPPGPWVLVQGSVGDFDLDGDLDVLALMKEAFGGQIVPLANQAGAFSALAALPAGQGLSAIGPVLLIDADADGLPDLLYRDSDGNTFILRRSGPALAFDAARQFAFKALDVGDYDRDGDTDIATYISNGAFFARNLALDAPSFGGVSQYGTATAGTSGVAPVLGAAGTPVTGATVELRMRHVSGTGPGILVASSGPGALAGFPFPSLTLALDLVGLGPPSTVGLVPTGGVSKGFALPTLVPPSAAGLDVYFQAFAIDLGAPDLVSATRGLHVGIWP